MRRQFEKKLKVLLVEDHGTTRLAMARLLREAGAEVTSARDGEEGLRLLVADRYDVLLTDLRMPGMDGFELISQAMALPDWQRPGRVIAISGEYEASSLTGVPVGFLSKPFDLDRLLDMLGGKPN